MVEMQGMQPIGGELNREPDDPFRYLQERVVQISSMNVLRYTPLVESIRDGNWNDAHQFIINDRNALTARINREGETVLHLAVQTNRSNDFIRKSIKMMSSDALRIVDRHGKTALLLAIEKDNTEVVEFLLARVPELGYIRCKSKKSPLQIAAQIGNRKMVATLLLVTKDHPGRSPYRGDDGQLLLQTLLEKKLYGSLIQVLHHYPKYIETRNQESIFPLSFLAEQPSAFFSGCSLGPLRRLLYFCIHLGTSTVQVPIFQSDKRIERKKNGQAYSEDGNSFIMKVQRVSMDLYRKFWIAIGKQVPQIMEIQQLKLEHQEAVKLVEWTCLQFTRVDYEEVEETFKGSLISAAKLGIEEIVQQILDSFPISIDDERMSILESVVLNRHAYILKLKNHRSYFKQMATDYHQDNEGNNILHLAWQSEIAKKKYANRSSFFEMMYELHWFKEMEKLVPLSYRVMKNRQGKTPETIFVEAHEDLLKEGERRLKGTATYCILLSAITGGFAFTEAISLVVNNITMNSYIYRGTAITVFCTAATLSIISSHISFFTFLVILMSPYTYRDFHRTLPQRLIIGIASLIVSILSIIVALKLSDHKTSAILIRLLVVAHPVYACINSVRVLFYSRWLVPPKKVWSY